MTQRMPGPDKHNAYIINIISLNVREKRKIIITIVAIIARKILIMNARHTWIGNNNNNNK